MAMSIELLRLVETAAEKAWRKVLQKYLSDNIRLTGQQQIAFRYQREFFCVDPAPITALRAHSVDLHPSLHKQFTEDVDFHITQFNQTKAELKHLFLAVFRHAKTKEELYPVLPRILHSSIENMEFKPMNSAKGITEDISTELLKKYQHTIALINAYVTVDSLL